MSEEEDAARYRADRTKEFYESAARARRNEEVANRERAISHERAARSEQRQIEQWQTQQRQQARQEERAIESQEMHRESHAMQLQKLQEERANAAEARHLAALRFSDPSTSGLLGSARYGTIEDAQRLSLFDRRGLYLGLMRGPDRWEGLFYNGDRHVVIFGGTRSGKGRTFLLPNLALHWSRSLIITDVKNGENAYASAEHRAFNLGHKVVFLNPKRMHGLPSVSINPFDAVIHAEDGQKFEKAAEVASVLSPVVNPGVSGAWVNEGAALLLQTVIAHTAATEPKRCTPGGMFDFFLNGDMQTLAARFSGLRSSPLASVRAFVPQFIDWMKSPNQWNGYSSGLAKALDAFSPESPYTKATDGSDFDARQITREPHTVYLIMPFNDIEAKGRWVSLMLHHFISETAAHPGPVRTLFLLDEFTQLPPIPGIVRAVNGNAGLGQNFVFLCQDKTTLANRYSKEIAGIFWRQRGIGQAWQVNDPDLMHELEYLAGKTSVNMISASMSHGGQIGTGINLTEQTRPLLQAEDMRMMAEDEQLIVPYIGPIFRARMMPWDRMEKVREVLRDPRAVLAGASIPAESVQRLIGHELPVTS
jgi:type IV secretion system protein VirD4